MVPKTHFAFGFAKIKVPKMHFAFGIAKIVVPKTHFAFGKHPNYATQNAFCLASPVIEVLNVGLASEKKMKTKKSERLTQNQSSGLPVFPYSINPIVL